MRTTLVVITIKQRAERIRSITVSIAASATGGICEIIPTRLDGCWRLSEHPKAAIQEHLKSGHTFRRNVQDIDSSGRVSSLSQHGECLEGRKETANNSLGTTGMVSAKDSRGHASASRDHQRLSARRGGGNMAAGKMEARK